MHQVVAQEIVVVGSVESRDEAEALCAHLAKFEIRAEAADAPSLLPGDPSRWGVAVAPTDANEAHMIIERGAPVLNALTGRVLKRAAWLGGPDLPFEIYLERFFA